MDIAACMGGGIAIQHVLMGSPSFAAARYSYCYCYCTL